MKLVEKFFPIINKLRFKIGSKTRQYDDRFWEWYLFFNESESWTYDKMKEYQFAQLKSILYEIQKTSQYYRKKWEGINIDRIHSFDDFSAQIPKISRFEYRQHFKNITSNKQSDFNITISSTSGTTGHALQFYNTIEDNYREWAAICHQWRRVGYDPANSIRAEFRGFNHNGKIINYYPKSNMIRCSILHYNRDTIREYGNEIKKYGIDYFHGYPSAIYFLAKKILADSISFPQPKAILLASEQIFDWQINTIKDAFNDSKIFAHYGCAERTVLGGYCEKVNAYHIMPHYSYIEIDKNTGEITGTNLYNTINGFIRYQMTDSASQYDYSLCDKCKRPYYPIIKKLAGRTEDYLYSIEKGFIPPAIITYPLKQLHSISEVQFFQETEEEIIVNYTVMDDLNNQDINNEIILIKKGLIEIFGKKMQIRFNKVDSFERNSSGKFKWIVSNLNQKNIL